MSSRPSRTVKFVRFDFHERNALPWRQAAGVVLLALLATLATYQYRWLGEVSNAERERMRSGLQTRASDFAQAFDRELTQIYLAFHFGPDVGDSRCRTGDRAGAAESAGVGGRRT